MSPSGEQLLRAANALARGNARLRSQLRRREFVDFARFLSALQHALNSVEIHEGFLQARRVAWKVLHTLRVEGD